MPKIFADFNFENFWEDIKSPDNERLYVGKPINDEMILSAEKELGFKLPSSYIELLKTQNGGSVNEQYFLTKELNSYSENCVRISAIFGIDKDKKGSVINRQPYLINDWGFPNIGIYFGDMATDHDMIAFDYSVCDSNGEPQIVHIYQEGDETEKYILAENFETFIKALITVKEYEEKFGELD